MSNTHFTDEQMAEIRAMKRPIFNPEINWGHLTAVGSIIVSAIVYFVAFSTDFRVMKNDVARHDKMIEKILDIQNQETINSSKLNQLLEDHLKLAQHSHQQP